VVASSSYLSYLYFALAALVGAGLGSSCRMFVLVPVSVSMPVLMPVSMFDVDGVCGVNVDVPMDVQWG